MSESGTAGKFGTIALWFVTIVLGLAMIGAGSPGVTFDESSLFRNDMTSAFVMRPSLPLVS